MGDGRLGEPARINGRVNLFTETDIINGMQLFGYLVIKVSSELLERSTPFDGGVLQLIASLVQLSNDNTKHDHTVG